MSVPPQSAAPAEHREWDDDSAIMVQSGQLGLRVGLRVYRVTPSQAARLRLAGPGPGMMPVIPGPAAAAGPRAGPRTLAAAGAGSVQLCDTARRRGRQRAVSHSCRSAAAHSVQCVRS